MTYPLDEILGTRATVRTLRVLCGPTSYTWKINRRHRLVPPLIDLFAVEAIAMRAETSIRGS